MSVDSPATPLVTVHFPPVKSVQRTRPRLRRLVGSLIAIMVLVDVCFWKVGSSGLSVGLFFAGLMALVLMNRTAPVAGQKGGPFHRWGTTSWIVLLAAGTLAATMIETGFSNSLVWLLLTVALAGDTYFRSVDSPWGRLLSQSIALVRAPGRVIWLGMEVVNAMFADGLGWMGGVLGGVVIAVPLLALTLIFGGLLSTGNAVFGNWTGSFFQWLLERLTFDVDPWRLALWFFTALITLPLLRPVEVGAWWWSWTEKVPRFGEWLPHRIALRLSLLVLVAMNGLFLVANFADAVFLWGHHGLPSGVTYSRFVHQGVEALTCTVLLSALVLVTIFQQALTLAQRRDLKWLAGCWIAQNVFLLMSVALRLKLYTEAYQLTVERLGVLIFLLLVAIGYGLLAVKIMRHKSISWLVGGVALAIFGTFYLTQFLNLGGMAADYNVAKWEKDRTRRLDVSYLQNLGVEAWPALRRAHELAPGDAAITEAWEDAGKSQEASEKTGVDSRYWREWSGRAWLNATALN